MFIFLDTTDVFPIGTLIQGSNGNFYGTTSRGGFFDEPGMPPFLGNGTVFQITPEGELTTLVHFQGDNGRSPHAGLALGVDGNFYGTTRRGGAHNLGTAFRVSPDGEFTSLVNFSWSKGVDPLGALVLGKDGNFYATTTAGGTYGLGMAFRMTPSGEVTVLASFNQEVGRNASGPLAKGPDGDFYGTATSGGLHSRGTLFRLTPAGSLTGFYHFTGENGANPRGGLLLASDGVFYGVTSSGGLLHGGTVFAFAASAGLSAMIGNPKIEMMGGTGHARLVFRAPPENAYQVEAAADPGGPWTSLGNPLEFYPGVYEFMDEEAAAFSSRFYRFIVE